MRLISSEFFRGFSVSMGFWFFVLVFRVFLFLALYIAPFIIECMRFYLLNHNWVDKEVLHVEIKC